jgi:hypothetical protein
MDLFLRAHKKSVAIIEKLYKTLVTVVLSVLCAGCLPRVVKLI